MRPPTEATASRCGRIQPKGVCPPGASGATVMTSPSYWELGLQMSNRPSDRPTKSRVRRVAKKASQRPAETAGASGSLAGLITAISLGNWLAAGTAAVGLLPVIWTFWKVNGGWNGIIKRIKFGDDPAPARSRRRVESAKAA